MATAANDFDTVANTKLFVSVAAPTTFDAAGYGALTWVEVGVITKFGNVTGREYNKATLETVSDAQIRSKKGNYSLPDVEMECGWAETDAGQIIIAAASEDYSIPSFKVVKQGGALRFFTAQVAKFVENLGTSNDAVKGSFTLLRQRNTVKA
ncbi:hypothetical protein [Massilia sp. S19_KUP03_FR1]|uniref:hypothetical protein n=1 Tax=Massilia sp. S19_KUP03_FR1 TaxID=3025503 RepID=UPI002FCD1117